MTVVSETTRGHQTLFHTRAGVIDLGIGAPDEILLGRSRRALGQAAASLFEEQGAHSSLQYGPRAGDPRFRQALATVLSEYYAGPSVDPEGLHVTTGATSGLGLVLARFFRPGMPAMVEDPTYFLARQHLQEAGLSLHTVCQDGQGMDIGALAQGLRALPELGEQRFRALIYCVPTYNNPTGISLPAERRAQLARLAREQRALVVE